MMTAEEYYKEHTREFVDLWRRETTAHCFGYHITVVASVIQEGKYNIIISKHDVLYVDTTQDTIVARLQADSEDEGVMRANLWLSERMMKSDA